MTFADVFNGQFLKKWRESNVYTQSIPTLIIIKFSLEFEWEKICRNLMNVKLDLKDSKAPYTRNGDF